MNLRSFDHHVGMDISIAEPGLFGILEQPWDFYLLRVTRKVVGSAIRYPPQSRGGACPRE